MKTLMLGNEDISNGAQYALVDLETMALDLPQASFDQYWLPMLESTNTASAAWNCDEDEYCWIYNADCNTGCGCYINDLQPITMQFGLIELKMPPQTYTQSMNNQTCFAWIGQSDDDDEVHLGWKFMVDYSM